VRTTDRGLRAVDEEPTGAAGCAVAGDQRVLVVTALHDSWGGGIATLGGATTTVEDSAFCGNGAQELGGAIFANQGATLAVSGTHFYGNTAANVNGLGGGAIAVAAASGPQPDP